MSKHLEHYRRSYDRDRLLENDLPKSPIELFGRWFLDEESVSKAEVNVMNLSTISADGFPKNRIVLLKSYSPKGLVFYTNYQSDKGKDIARSPKVCLSFFFEQTQRQVIVKGIADKLSKEESARYFSQRPKGHQLGALASLQSREVSSRDILEQRLKNLEQRYIDRPVPCPDYWGGYIVSPISLEFWQGRQNRLHDRIRYTLQNKNIWNTQRLEP